MISRNIIVIYKNGVVLMSAAYQCVVNNSNSCKILAFMNTETISFCYIMLYHNNKTFAYDSMNY